MVDAGGAGCDEVGWDRDGPLGLGSELVAVDGDAWYALGFGLRVGVDAQRGGVGAAPADFG